MSHTPETDAKASDIIGFFSCATVPADFARQLERERDTAKKQNRDISKGLKRLSVLNESLLDEIIDARKERDEAREKAKPWIWIPVSQALPDDDQTVLIHMDDGKVWTGFLDAEVWRFVSGDRIEAEVLHWRPFPNPPKP